MHAFTLREQLDLSLHKMGHEQEPLLMVEGILRDPAELIDYAATQVAFTPAWGPNGGYPGLRAPAPLNYVNQLVRALDPKIRRAFGLGDVRLARAECNFSMVVQRPDELTPLQRIPHVDTLDPLQFALLHYLCDETMGGTAFYRHAATGFETLSPDRWPQYEAVRAREVAGLADPSAYIRGDTRDYRQTAAFEARFDRVILYRSRTLHSGQIPRDFAFSDDPRKGRLTANIFVNYAPR